MLNSCLLPFILVSAIIKHNKEVMAHFVHETHRGDDIDNPVSLAARIVYMLSSVLIGLLTVRVALSLLGANKGNAFADFIYGVTAPFVAPFLDCLTMICNMVRLGLK